MRISFYGPPLYCRRCRVVVDTVLHFKEGGPGHWPLECWLNRRWRSLWGMPVR